MFARCSGEATHAATIALGGRQLQGAPGDVLAERVADLRVGYVAGVLHASNRRQAARRDVGEVVLADHFVAVTLCGCFELTADPQCKLSIASALLVDQAQGRGDDFPEVIRRGHEFSVLTRRTGKRDRLGERVRSPADVRTAAGAVVRRVGTVVCPVGTAVMAPVGGSTRPRRCRGQRRSRRRRGSRSWCSAACEGCSRAPIGHQACFFERDLAPHGQNPYPQSGDARRLRVRRPGVLVALILAVGIAGTVVALGSREGNARGRPAQFPGTSIGRMSVFLPRLTAQFARFGESRTPGADS